MLASTLNMRLAQGLAKAASITGTTRAIYRPVTASNPVSGVPLRMLTCAFDHTPSFSFRSTGLPAHPIAYLLGDPTAVLQGDYIVGDEIYFVSRIEPLRPALCILCNQTIDLLNPDLATSAGTNGYGGRTADTDVVLAQKWPASMLARGRLDTDDARLPSDIKAGSFVVSCPPIPDVTIEYGMRIRDSLGQGYAIVSAELSQFGWNLLLGLTST